MKAAIIWFRNDLRLADNPALQAALAAALALGGPVIPVFVLDDAAAGDWRRGGASRWWLHYSLQSLAHELAARGASLCLRRGDARTIIPELAAQTKAASVHAGRSFEPWARALDRDVAQGLQAMGVAFTRHLTALLHPPDAVKTKTGGSYGVYSPFARACFERPVADEIAAPAALPGGKYPAGDRLEDWHLLPTQPDWAARFGTVWQPGEAGAQKRLKTFIAGALQPYKEARNIPGRDSTSGLSPHLHFGELSPGQVWRAAAAAKKSAGQETFLKEVLWREFSYHLLWHHPQLPEQPLREAFATFSWDDNPASLAAWQHGQTGVPIVDAGMRQLWQTGWMHNRVRMIAASYLVKHLLIPWQAGEAWFWDTLVDADLANNAASWQWVAGCGADAAPYFRIFNPVLQGLKFDPDGAYVRKYVPELAGLPDADIHAPWEAGAAILTKARVTLGETYPRPIISLVDGRARALAAFERIKQ